jgi:acetoacetate decarboxylase
MAADPPQVRSFAAPLDPTGHASLYGPPPWRFAGWSLSVIARCPAEAVAALVPAPLSPWGEPLVRFSVHFLQCDLGLGWRFAQEHPERSQFHEAVVGIAVRHDNAVGYWDPFLWCDSDAELAVGREMYGWPQRLGAIALTAPHALHGWRVGDCSAGLVSRLGRPVFEASMTIARPGDLETSTPPFTDFFTERILPNPTTGTAMRELFVSRMDDVVIDALHSGPATLALQAPELQALAPFEVVGGRVNKVTWSKNRAKLLSRRAVEIDR